MAYFTTGEFRARYPDLTVGSYPDVTVESYRTIAESIIEKACGVAFEPRNHTETLTWSEQQEFRAAKWPVRSVTSISVNGVAETIGNYGVINQDTVYPAIPFTGTAATGLATVAVTYSHGYDTVPTPIKEAALVLTKSLMVKGPIDDRVLRAGDDSGFTTFAPMAPTGIQFVDEMISQYRLPTVA